MAVQVCVEPNEADTAERPRGAAPGSDRPAVIPADHDKPLASFGNGAHARGEGTVKRHDRGDGLLESGAAPPDAQDVTPANRFSVPTKGRSR